MKLTGEEIRQLQSWKEGECSQGGTLPMLPKVCFNIIAAHSRTPKTARGKLRRAKEAIDLVLAVLEEK